VSVQKKVLIGLGIVVLIYAVWTVIQNSGNGEARSAARDAVVQLKAALDKGITPEELRTLNDAVQSQFTLKPGAFSDCRKTFADLQTHTTTVQSYWWSETYRKDGVRDLTDDCNTLLSRLK
jgi:hypothetical protein